MDKTFQPAEIESRWYREWEENGWFAPSGDGPPWSIMIPPPNVTGSLHMGHGFQAAIMDALVRYHRMKGCNTLWQAGTDHAGIATQMVVERTLEQEGQTRRGIGREAFLERAWAWKEESGGTITGQLRRLGASPDWSRERFTLDPGLSAAVREVFVRLYREELIYRGQRLVNWDPALGTAVSDLEVVSEEEQGHLWHFRYPLSSGEGVVTVATTRPETMLGDTAVAVHPEDERYAHLVGQTVDLPLTGRQVSIIADDSVDPEFGTGCVKITPAHDFRDWEMGRRHDLELINIFTAEAALNDNVPEPYRGLDRFEARKRVVDDLDALGLLERVEDHALKVPRGDRSGAVVEPWLTDQWYVHAKALAEPAIAAVKNGDIEFVPRQWENTYFAWMRDIQDWCISRQLWWGHRIPAWYDAEGNVYVGADEADARAHHGLGPEVPLRQDEDVLDTWFSSALWTFSTLGWPERTPDLDTWHPTSVLVTGFDIIFFWVARMIMMTLHFLGEAPFHKVYVHGLVRDSHGQKMSKSKGNVLDPIDLVDGIGLDALVAKRIAGLMQPHLAERIERQTREEFPEGIAAHGADALRFTYYSLASTGRDINFDTGRIHGFRNFCNKIWNASRYVLAQWEDQANGPEAATADGKTTLADRWIISRLQRAERVFAEAVEGYRFDLASQAVYDFIWNEYCDWYLELSKPVLWDPEADPALKAGTRRTLLLVLEAALRLAHPLMPFITEDIWRRVAPLAGIEGPTIMLQPFPECDTDKIDADAEADIEWLQGIVVGVRNIRGEMKIPPGRELSALLRGGDNKGSANYAANCSGRDQGRLEQNRQYLKKLAGLGDIRFLDKGEEAPPASTALVGDLEILVPLADLVDREAELARLDREIDKLDHELERLRGKMANASFIEKAPAEVVAREREKLESGEQSLRKLRQQQSDIQRM